MHRRRNARMNKYTRVSHKAKCSDRLRVRRRNDRIFTMRATLTHSFFLYAILGEIICFFFYHTAPSCYVLVGYAKQKKV